MKRSKLVKIKAQIRSFRGRGGLKARELEELAKSLGRKQHKRGHEPTWINEDYPELKIYISYGPRAGDNMTLLLTKANFEIALRANFWELLLDGDGEFFNVIRLNIENNTLTEIYRHRKYFELP